MINQNISRRQWLGLAGATVITVATLGAKEVYDDSKRKERDAEAEAERLHEQERRKGKLEYRLGEIEEKSEKEKQEMIYESRVSKDEEDLLARLAFGEARGTNDNETIAMLYTVIERQKDKRWSSDLKKVILQRKQYSCFNKNDVNYEKVWDAENYNPKAWERCKKLAKQVLKGEVENPVKGANHYATNNPYWKKDAKSSKKIGTTTFYRL